MEKLSMCRICLVENVRMFVVNNRNLHELYEKLTDIPFVTEDRRPILACFFCCTKLKQCCRLLRKCLEAEEQFAQMMNEDYKPNPLINQDRLKFFSGFIKSPIEHISIVDECQTESIAIKEELPAVCEGLDDIIEPKKEYQDDGLESELDNSCLDVADIPPHYSESDFGFEFKTEVEEEVSKKIGQVGETERATVEKKPKLDTRRIKLEDAITAKQTRKEKSDSKVIRKTPQLTSKPGTYFNEPFKCDVCQRCFSHKSHLTYHIRIHTGEKPYNCDVCQRSFSLNTGLRRHIRLHTGEKPYKCNVCRQRSFSQEGYLRKHIRNHTVEKSYKCDVCQLSFHEKGILTKHIATHTGEKPYKCDVLQSSFSRNSDLLRHIRIHSGEKPYNCDVCQRSFKLNSGLRRHIRLHTDEKPYKCNVCQRSFSQEGYLRKHIRSHTVEKSYKCDVCQLSFHEKGILRRDIAIHTGEKPYKCDVCQSSFCRNSDLLRHIRIHSGEKPYKCFVCRRSFNQKSNLTTHFRIHTSQKTL